MSTKFKMYSTIFATAFFGVVAGYGAIISMQFVALHMSRFFVNAPAESDVAADSSRDAQASLPTEAPAHTIRRALGFMTQSGTYHVMNHDTPIPRISAPSYAVVDMETGETIMQRDSFVERPIASVSKLMTALVTFKQIDQTAAASVSYKAASTYGTQGGLRVGERLSVTALLHALMLQSSNDAAEVLAEIIGREKFLDYMNAEADFLGMKNTRYEDPSGLSEHNVSSADDLGLLIQYIYTNYPELVDITKTRSYRSGAHTWYNNSVFSSDAKYLGGKNGYTDEARYTLVAMFRLPLGHDSESRDVAIILLGGEQNEKDARALILYLLRNVEFY